MRTTLAFLLLPVLTLALAGCQKEPGLQGDTGYLEPGEEDLDEQLDLEEGADQDTEIDPDPDTSEFPVEHGPAVERVDSDDTETDTRTGVVPEPKIHIVKQGDTFYSLAKKYYGNAKYWPVIGNANPDVSATNLRVGQRLVIPAQPAE